MCGRYANSRASAELGELFDAVDETGGALRADYNIAPTDPVPLVRMSLRPGQAEQPGRAGRVLSVARWGLVPPWAKDPRAGARMINARAETITDSRAYARPFVQRRCLVPADGWYEWSSPQGRAAPSPRGRAGAKQAYFMAPADGSVLAFAGVWTGWQARGSAERLLTFSVVTVPAVGDLALVHDRMPLVLPPSRWPSWLGEVSAHPGAGEPDPRPDGDLLAPPPRQFVAGLEIRPVGPAVGDVRNDGPWLLARVPAPTLTGPVDLQLF